MKFTEHLSTHLTPEWRKQYINYEVLNDALNKYVKEFPSIGDDKRQAYVFQFDKNFFDLCETELKKVDAFFLEKLAEAKRKYVNLNDDFIHLSHQKGRSNPEFKKLKLAFSEFYLGLVLLQNYQKLNYSGFQKVLRKHDRVVIPGNAGKEWIDDFLERAYFPKNTEIPKMITDIEQFFATNFEEGNRERAMKCLRVPPISANSNDSWTTFNLGVAIGMFIILLINIVLAICLFGVGTEWRNVGPLFRGPFLVTLFLFLWGCNVYFWRSYGVNHILIFEIDPRNHLNEQDVMEIAAYLAIIWELCFLSYILHTKLSIPQYLPVLILYIIFIIYLFNPTKTLHFNARLWTLKYLFRLLCVPMIPVVFTDFWFGDQFNSIPTAFSDLEHALCIVIHNDNLNTDVSGCDKRTLLSLLFQCLPAWFRFGQVTRRYFDTGQAFPHLLNACKYGSLLIANIFGFIHYKTNDHFTHNLYANPWLYIWICTSIFAQIFVFWWDMKMDWGLFVKTNGKLEILRAERVYPSQMFYKISIIQDIIALFLRVLPALCLPNTSIDQDIVLTVESFAEIFRRFIWNFFRLENEHLNNCGQFRAVRDITIRPMDDSFSINVHLPKVYTSLERERAKKENLLLLLQEDDEGDVSGTTGSTKS